MEQADQGLELGKGASRGQGGFRDKRWRGKFPHHADQNRGPVLLPNNYDKRAWNDQVELKAQGDNPQKRQRRIGNSSLSHPRARNSVVLSTLLKVVQMNGIARKKNVTPL